MQAAAAYVKTLCCSALICGVILHISGTSGPGGRMRQMICGIFLVLVAISPLRKMDFSALDREFASFSAAAEAAAMDGRQQAGKALDEDISHRCEAYILDKAGTLSVSLQVQVEVDPGTHVPCSVRLSGRVSQRQKEILTQWIARDLGLERSLQQWTEAP